LYFKGVYLQNQPHDLCNFLCILKEQIFKINLTTFVNFLFILYKCGHRNVLSIYSFKIQRKFTKVVRLILKIYFFKIQRKFTKSWGWFWRFTFFKIHRKFTNFKINLTTLYFKGVYLQNQPHDFVNFLCILKEQIFKINQFFSF
jgi:hypothetical protein